MNTLEEANQIINGERRQAYGPVKDSFEKVAKLWSIAVGTEITAPKVATMMILFKVARELNAHKRDNCVDINGYSELLQQLHEHVDN